jgi:hypothetical protein
MVIYPTPANGSLVADFPRFPNRGVTGGGYGVADLWVQPFTLGWHLKCADIQVGDAFMVPTGRYAPGASNNIGTGYFGNHLQTGTTFYVTKNKATSVNLFTDWEVHGQRQGTNNTYKTPGQAFTDEWGVGQILPLKKDFSKLLQLGVIGYDQWQVTGNGGAIPIGPIVGPANVLPLLLGSCCWWSGHIHSACEAPKFLLQVRTRIQVLLSHSRKHHRVRRRVDPGNSKTSRTKVVGKIK